MHNFRYLQIYFLLILNNFYILVNSKINVNITFSHDPVSLYDQINQWPNENIYPVEEEEEAQLIHLPKSHGSRYIVDLDSENKFFLNDLSKEHDFIIDQLDDKILIITKNNNTIEHIVNKIASNPSTKSILREPLLSRHKRSFPFKRFDHMKPISNEILEEHIETEIKSSFRDFELNKMSVEQEIRNERNFLTNSYNLSNYLQYANLFNDPYFPLQWNIMNTGQSHGSPGFDNNILPAWKMGYSGKGIVISIVDDGVQHNHPDIKTNYDPFASIDINDNDPDPMPRDDDFNSHGTKCAGIISAVANNNVCVVGVAFNSRIGGIRVLDGIITDSVESKALSFSPQYIDIYVCSWGPRDDGMTFGRPGPLTTKSINNGVNYGRKGYGSIYVWATGNGGTFYDDCNSDGYSSNRNVISIGSVSDHGVSTYFGENCASILASAFTSGSHDLNGPINYMCTTTIHSKCTTSFVGTSSAAPHAAAVIALVLEANPYLTVRDIQHLLIKTSRPTFIGDLRPGWIKNGANLWFHHKIGFGALNAGLMVAAAKNWKSVDPLIICEIVILNSSKPIAKNGYIRLDYKADSNHCSNPIKIVEHVEVYSTIRHKIRGDLSIHLFSPTGTKSTLLRHRFNDKSSNPIRNWNFTTVANWGESFFGVWTIEFMDSDKHKMQNKQYKKTMSEKNLDGFEYNDDASEDENNDYENYQEFLIDEFIQNKTIKEIKNDIKEGKFNEEQAKSTDSTVNHIYQRAKQNSYKTTILAGIVDHVILTIYGT